MALTSGQLNINIGIPNSPQNSDSLYTAFGKIQNNFLNVFTEATSFSSANISTGIGISNTVVSGTVTLVNSGVTSISSTDTNLIISTPNGEPTLTLASVITGLDSISTSNANITGTTRTANITVNNSVLTSNVIASGDITANNITVTSVTSVGTLLKLTPQVTAPSNPSQGTIYYDSFMNMLRVFNGSTWGNIALA